MMVDTKKIRKNLGSRDSIGLKREDVLELLDSYEDKHLDVSCDSEDT